MSIVQMPPGNPGNKENVQASGDIFGKKKISSMDLFSNILKSKLMQGDSSLKMNDSSRNNLLLAMKSLERAGLREESTQKMNPGQGVLISITRSKISEFKSSVPQGQPKTVSEKKQSGQPDEKSRSLAKAEIEKNEEKQLNPDELVLKDERSKVKKTKVTDGYSVDSRSGLFVGMNQQNTQVTVNHAKSERKRDSDSNDPVLDNTNLKKGSDRERMTITVNDLRKAEVPEKIRITEKESLKPSSDGSSEREIRIVLKDSSGGKELETSVRIEHKETPFRAMLEKELRETYNTEIAKSGSIILRDGGAGTIRLALKPESMGNVKFELNLAENSITGTIIVENDEVRETFERNLSSLEDAFKAQGFDTAKLAVSVGGRYDGGSESRNGDEIAKPFFSERLRQVSGNRIDEKGKVLRDGALDIIV